jgi:hypothetical protein
MARARPYGAFCVMPVNCPSPADTPNPFTRQCENILDLIEPRRNASTSFLPGACFHTHLGLLAISCGDSHDSQVLREHHRLNILGQDEKTHPPL